MRPADAILTGFTRNAELCRRAFAPLLELKQQGVLRAVRYVTWDSAEIDGFVPSFEGVEVTRVQQPQASGNASRRGFEYQSRNLEAALSRVPEGALVVKSRPDFVFRTDFLKGKLRDFDRLCAVPADGTAFGHRLPRVPFARKIWIPWADANQPFFYEDAAFIGLKSDLARLLVPDLDAAAGLLDDGMPGSLVHVLRYVNAFTAAFPIFKRYVAEYAAFVNDIAYRRRLVAMLLEDGFFWHILLAHAWVLRSAFHVDCGETGDLAFYPNTVNADWSDFARLKLAAPYDQIDMWRRGTRAGEGVMPALTRIYGRLMDDAWQQALFARAMGDMPPGVLGRIARGVSLHPTGCLGGVEDTFYKKLRAFRLEHLRDAA